MREMVILDNLDPTYKDKWHKQFVVPQRTCSEGLWRRTQNESIKIESGWKSDQDCRRRMIHFFDQYDLIEKNGQCKLIIKDIYLWLCTTLPKEEMDQYLLRIVKAAEEYSWEKTEDGFSKDGLSMVLKLSDVHPEDNAEGRSLKDEYQTLEVCISSRPEFRPNTHSPWGVLKSGIRKKGTRTNDPHIITDLGELLKFAPYQIELGGGASIELGVPPLNHMHGVYHVTSNLDSTFIFGERDSLIVEVLMDHEKFYKDKASVAYKQSLLAEPNDFYKLLQELSKGDLVVGDVITNNFDGLTSLVGLKEKYVRRYEDSDIIPHIDFDDRAKSLVVIGSHADRRLIQEAARRKGLQIIYIDPERYITVDGREVLYPLETLKNEDILVSMSTGEFTKTFKNILQSQFPMVA